MAPPPLRQFASTSAMTSSQVTEDTPPDLLEGTMDLTVILPTGHRVNMDVHRSTPMMDLLIQVTTAHKVSPGGHVIHVVSDNRLLSYKPSTPIGTLDTSIIQIVAKNRMNEEAKKRRAHLVTQAIEKNVRLKVNLPRNQLAVYRVPPKTLISDVLAMVCKDRCFDLENHEIRHPVNVDEKLRGSCTLADYQLQEVSVVPKDFRAPPLSVTDLITMAAISSSSSHTEDKKRRGILSLFSRKTKSSAGESSLSSGSAGERSVSPARSDESTDGRPTSRPLSPASSSATLTNSTHVQGPPAPPPPLSRPPSALNLAGKSRKRQAPAPPPVHPPQQGSYNEGKAAADFKNERHSNGKTSESAAFETRCKAQSSDASGFGEYDDQSPYASPSGSEVSSVEATRLPQSSHPTNLTSVTSTSSLSLVSRSKRRAPPPPKPPPTARAEDLPSAIPEEESESPAPAEEDDARAEVAGQDVVRSPSPASSHVSSVSSLSSVEHQAASTPLKPPLSPQTPPEEEEEEEEETTPPSTPPPPPSDSYVSGAALVGAMPRNPPPPLAVEQTEPSFVITYTPTTTEHSLANALSAGTSTPADPIPTPAHSLNPAASQNPSGMMHEDAAGSVGVTNYTRLDTSEASGLVSSDRLAEESRPLPPRQLHHQNASTSQEKTRPGVPHRAASIENGSQRRGAADNPRKVNSVGYSSVGDGDVRNQWNVSAKRDSVDIRDAITPIQSNMGSIPAIPTFRIVTKSHTAVQKDDDTSRKFVADGKTQKFSDGDKFGSKSKGLGNPLSRGRLIHQDDVDFDDDLDINEDMFEPRQLFGLSSSSVNLSGNSNSSATENGHEAAVSSTPVGGSLPQPVPRRLAPNAEGSGGVPVPVPRNQLNRRQAPVPPKMEEKRETQVNDHKGSVDVSRESVISEAEQFEKLMQQGPDEEFKVHVSSVANLDPDMLSLLSEECVDEGRPKSLSLNSSSASETSDASREVSEAFGKRVGVDPGETSSRATLRPPSPPTKTIEAQTTASSYRAGYLSMIAQMADWDDPVSYDTDSDDENQKDSSPPNLPAHRPGQYPTSAAVAARGSDHGGNDFISPLCSDTDHEVQTRSASFSSETSEESSDSSNRKRDVPRRNNEGDVEGSKSGSSSPSTRSVTSSSSGRSTESSGDSDNGKEDRVGGKKQEVERASSKSSSSASSSSSSSSSSESSEDEVDEEAERPVAGKPLSAEAKVKSGNTPDKEEAKKVLVEVLQKEQKHDQARRGGDSGPEKRSRRDSTSSESSEDSEGDVDGDKDRDVVRDPRITANSPLSSVRIPGANEISNKSRDEKLAILANEKHAQSTTRKSRSCSSSSSASSVLSSSSSSSSTKGETRRVAPSERDTIETHLEAAFAEVSPRDVTGERIILDLPLGPQESSDWEYKIPDPPTPFKDVPPSRVRDEESSTTSSEPLPEVLSDVPSGFKDSPGSSIPEAKNMEIIEKIESDTETKLALGVDTSDSVSVLSSSRKSSLSSHSSSYMSDEKAKQNVIEELKTVVSSEPRIVELRPKVRHVEMIMSVPKEDAASDDNAELRVEVPPAKLNYPMEQSFVPRVVAKRPAKNEEVNRKAVVGRRLKESTSSYESAFGNDSHDEVDISGRSRSRSGSSTSYESAPPPVPEIPPPLDSESDGRRGRSSSSTSESSNASGRRSAHRASNTGTTASLSRASDASASASHSRASDTNTDSSLSRAPVMSFSISTYKSRAEETSYDKKLGKSESFSHQSRPKRSTLSKTDSFAAYRDQPEPPSFVDELLEETEKPPPIPEKTSAPSNPAVVSKILGLREKSRSQQHIPTFERSSGAFGKPLVPPNKPSVQRFGNAGVDGHFAYPEPARPPRRLQRADSQERLGRATSLSNLATPNFELRKAQSSSELSCGSVPPNPIAASNAAEMPGFPGMMGMPMMMTGGGGPGGMMPNDSRLAEEFVKLQQDFFKWQQQLLQNQHVLHSRVAPLASNPPQLQSVGVMRDIMSQEAPAEVPPPVRSGPVERIIPIKMEMTTTSTSSSSSTNFGGNELRPSAAPGRLSQSMQDITISDAGQPGLNSSRLVSQQMPSQRRWPNEPNVSVGAWNERPSQPVGVYRDQDYVTSSPKSRSTQDLSSAGPVGPGTHYQQRPTPAAYQPPAPSAYQPPAPAAYQPAQTDAQAPQQFAQPQVAQPQAPVHAQQFQALPPQQQRQFAQFLQQQQQRQEPDRATFWRDFDAKKGSADEADSARPQYRNSYQEPMSSQDEPSKPLTYFGQDVQVQDPPMTYYYNGDGAAKPAGSSFVSSRPKAAETEAPGPRYTSVVTVSPDKEVSPGGEAVTKDKVRSVVQLNNDPPRNVPRQVAPVVRGFRQPGDDKAGAQGSTFHSKIINSASKAQPQPSSNATLSSSSVAPARGPSPPQSVPIPDAPTAARLVAAVSQPAPRGPSPAPALSSSTRVSPPKMGPSQGAPSRTSPSPRSSPSSGPAFAGVQLKPVPAALRASPPSDVFSPPPAPVLPPAPPSASQSGGAPPPPPPPAPPMAPPPPPPMAGAPERRTASGKRIVSAKTGPELDAREELMVAIKNHGGLSGLRRTGNYAFSNESS